MRREVVGETVQTGGRNLYGLCARAEKGHNGSTIDLCLLIIIIIIINIQPK